MTGLYACYLPPETRWAITRQILLRSLKYPPFLMLSELNTTGLNKNMASAADVIVLPHQFFFLFFFLTSHPVGNLCMQLAATSAQCGANEKTAVVVFLMAALSQVLLAQATRGSQMDCKILHFLTEQLLFSPNMDKNKVPPEIKMIAMLVSSTIADYMRNWTMCLPTLFFPLFFFLLFYGFCAIFSYLKS